MLKTHHLGGAGDFCTNGRPFGMHGQFGAHLSAGSGSHGQPYSYYYLVISNTCSADVQPVM